MPIRNESNRAYLIASLDIYRDAMRDFITRELKKNQRRRVADILRKYPRASHRRYDVRDPRSMFDVNDFFFIIRDNWQEVFGEAFNGDKFVLDTLRQITSIRNNAAHPAYGTDIDRAWALARIYDMSDVLGRIGAASEKVHVQAIWNQLDIQNVQSTPLPTQPEQMERYGNNAKVSANIPTPQAPVRANVGSDGYWVNRDGSGNTIHKDNDESCWVVDKYACEPKWEKHDTLESVYASYPPRTRKCKFCFS